ncbi:hypothetical protein PC114_g10900 [Phytophthora cactorum]|nr:hypothetical protein PC114_g10900 [Phytophthora cactorum]
MFVSLQLLPFRKPRSQTGPTRRPYTRKIESTVVEWAYLQLPFSNTIATSSRTGSHSKCVDPFAIIRRPRSAFATRDFQFPLRFPFLSLRELVECFTRPFNSTSKALGQKLWHFHTSSLLLRVLC